MNKEKKVAKAIVVFNMILIALLAFKISSKQSFSQQAREELSQTQKNREVNSIKQAIVQTGNLSHIQNVFSSSIQEVPAEKKIH